MLTIAENFAASQVLTEWPTALSYDELLTAIENRHEDVIVWEPHEDYDPGEVVDLIESLRVSFLNSVSVMVEGLCDAVKQGEPMTIAEQLTALEKQLGIIE